MRFRKKQGKKPARIVLTEVDIFNACREYIERLPSMKGSRLDSVGGLAVPKVMYKVDKLGRKLRKKIEFWQDIHDE